MLTEKAEIRVLPQKGQGAWSSLFGLKRSMVVKNVCISVSNEKAIGVFGLQENLLYKNYFDFILCTLKLYNFCSINYGFFFTNSGHF